MQHETKQDVGNQCKMQEEELDRGPHESTEGPPLASASQSMEHQEEEEGLPARTPYPYSEGLCHSGRLILALIMLLLCLLGSWAVVHLTLGIHGGTPFRISASYDQHNDQNADATRTATIEPSFTTNCTVGK